MLYDVTIINEVPDWVHWLAFVGLAVGTIGLGLGLRKLANRITRRWPADDR